MRNLGDNPVVMRMQLAAERRQRRKRDRSSLLIAIIVSGAMLAISYSAIIIETYAIGNYPTGMAPSPWSMRGAMLDWLHYSALLFICSFAFLRLFNGIYATYREALELLGDSSRQRSVFVVDDLMGVTPLGNGELIVGFLRVLLPPLWRRVLLFYSVALWMYITVLVDFWHLAGINLSDLESLKLVLLLSPITLASLLLTSMLATCCMVLFLIACGREVRSPIVSNIGAVINTLVLIPWAMITSVLALVFASGDSFLPSLDDRVLGQYFGVPFAAVVLLVLTGLILLLIHEFRWARPVFAIGGPLLIPGLTLLLAVILWSIAGSGGGEEIGMLFGNCAMSFGSVMALNLHGVPSLMCLGATPVEILSAQMHYEAATSVSVVNVSKVLFPHIMLFEWYRFPVLLLLQFSMLQLTYLAAINAIQRRRQA